MLDTAEIKALLDSRDKKGLKDLLADYSAEEVADLLNHLEEENLLHKN